MFRLAHVSDLHLCQLPPVTWSQLANKRLLGYLSWQLRRRRSHLQAVLDALVRDLHAVEPDHVAITGDLVNLALPAEFMEAAAWLRRLGPPEWISLVPGNHDALVEVRPGDGWNHWRAYATSDADAFAPNGADFPFLRRRGPLAIVGLSTAVAIAARLRDRPPRRRPAGAPRSPARATCARTAAAGSCSPTTAPSDGISRPRRRLIDAAELRGCIARHGADLILHGHEHVFSFGQIAGR